MAFARRTWLAAFVVLVAAAAQAQDIEPRNYSNAPVGVNFLVAGVIHTRGGLEFDPSLPAENEDLKVTSGVVAYARTFGLGGHSRSLLAGAAPQSSPRAGLLTLPSQCSE